jgi:hypothetical protein
MIPTENDANIANLMTAMQTRSQETVLQSHDHQHHRQGLLLAHRSCHPRRLALMVRMMAVTAAQKMPVKK